jgi:K+-sensing histidine kinase KdpD
LNNLELVQARVARSEAEAALLDRNELLDAISATLQNRPNADELERLTNSLADFGRIERGELTLRTQDTDLVDILHAACDAARQRAGGRHVLVHTPAHAPARCDPVRTRQVLDDLLDEALRRTASTGRIQVRLETVSVQLVVVSLQADGCDADRPLGAGLQISRTLMRRQGGSVATAVSPGGTFEVEMTLPGSPHPMQRGTNRSRRLTRSALASRAGVDKVTEPERPA